MFNWSETEFKILLCVVGGPVSSSSGSMSGTRLLPSSNRRPLDPITQSFIPAGEAKNGDGLPPIVERIQGENVYSQFDITFSKGIKADDEKTLKFAINSNLFVLVKRVVCKYYFYQLFILY